MKATGFGQCPDYTVWDQSVGQVGFVRHKDI